MDVIYRWIVIGFGIFMFIFNLFEIAKKKMDVSIGSSWTIMAVAIIVFGSTFDFSVLRRNVNILNIMLVFLFILAMIVALYLYALRITELKKKNIEVAIYLSMLKSERGDKHEVIIPPIAASHNENEEESTGVGA